MNNKNLRRRINALAGEAVTTIPSAPQERVILAMPLNGDRQDPNAPQLPSSPGAPELHEYEPATGMCVRPGCGERHAEPEEPWP
jgi:hypothetical protein